MSQILLPFLAPAVLYPLTFHSLLPPTPSALSILKTRETLSFFHCLFTTFICLWCLHKHNITHLLSPASLPPNRAPRIPNADLAIITTKSTIGNAITAYETGYLLGDTMIVLYAWRLCANAKARFNVRGKELDTTPRRTSDQSLKVKHLLLHHLPLLLAFSVLQLYISLHLERGVLIIIVLMLQNFSSPFGTLKWYLSLPATSTATITTTTATTKSTASALSPTSQSPRSLTKAPTQASPKSTSISGTALNPAIAVADLAYLSTYLLTRVILPVILLHKFSAVQDRNIFQGVWSLRWHCSLGTAAMLGVNCWWFVGRVRRSGRMGREGYRISSGM